jgi:flagellar biosynthesis chaperone FliJ
MKMQELEELESFTVEEFQSDFDNLMKELKMVNHLLYEMEIIVQ